MIIELEKVDKKKWNTWMMDKGIYGTIFQSTYWAEYLKKTYGDNPIYVASLDKNGEFQGSLLAIKSSYAKFSFLTGTGVKYQILSKLYKYLALPILQYQLPFIYWENGPIITPKSLMDDTKHRDIYDSIIQKIVDIAREKNCYEIKFARPAFFEDYKDIYSLFGFQDYRMGTLLNNLDQSLEVLWKNLTSKCRYSIKNAEKKGIEITRAQNLNELKEFYDLNVQTYKRAGTKIFPFSYYKLLWDYFYPINKIDVFIARYRDNPVATGLFLKHNKIMHIFTGGDSDYQRSNKLYATEFLMWQVLKRAHETGFKYFDHSGVELYKIDAGDKRAKGIYRYKSKFGGELVEYHDYRKHIKNSKIVNFLNNFLADSIKHN